MDKHNWEFRNTLFLSHLPPPCPSFPLMKKKKKKPEDLVCGCEMPLYSLHSRFFCVTSFQVST